MGATVDPSWQTLHVGTFRRLRDPKPGAKAFGVELADGRWLIVVRGLGKFGAAVTGGPGQREPLDLPADDLEALWAKAQGDAGEAN